MATRYAALVAGIAYLAVGLLGLIGIATVADTTLPPLAVSAQYGRLLGLFPVNVLHNIVHLLIGIWGIAAYRTFGASRTFLRVLAIFYGLLVIMGLLPEPFRTTFGLIPIMSHDVWLHALSALLAAYFGFVARQEPGEYVAASARR